VAIAMSGLVLALVACTPPENAQPTCRPGPPTVLMAESVPSASLIPCVDALPRGWTWNGFRASESGSTFSLDQQDGDGLLEVEFVATCDVTGDGRSVTGFPGTTRYRSTEGGGAMTVWLSTFPGGCSRASLTFGAPADRTEIDRIARAISFVPREQLSPAAVSPRQDGAAA
jgi:hypothetical protein